MALYCLSIESLLNMMYMYMATGGGVSASVVE